MPGPKRTSIKDVAKEVNLSISTVSRVLNGKADEYRIAKKSQKLILDAAEKLNYFPNYLAANLKSGKNNTLALSIPSLGNPFFASLASEINKCLREMGFITILSETNENINVEKDVLDSLLKRNIGGLIIAPCGEDHEHILDLQKQGLPIVCVDRYFENLDIPYVSTNNYAGAYEATKYLIECGHKKILSIQGVPQSVPNKERVRGFKSAMQDAGIEKFNITGNDFTIQNGYLETKLALNRKERPTAIFTYSNTIALGAIKAIVEDKLQIPDDISLLTFDDHPYLDYLVTPLSCVVQPQKDLANLAVKFLISLLNNKAIEAHQVQLNPTLKVRRSVKKLIHGK